MDEMDPQYAGQSEQSDGDVPRDAEADSGTGSVVEEVRRGGLKSLFTFDTMFFPVFAHYVFVAFVVLVLLVGLGGVVVAFSTMAREGFSDGMYGLLQTVAMVAFLIVAGRLWIELAMVAFKINEAVQDIREHIKKLR